MTPLIAKGFGVPVEKATELTDYLTEKLGSKQALGRYRTSTDISNTALFQASDQSSYLICVIISVDGGISSYPESTSDGEILAAAQEFLSQKNKKQ
ncbi:short chain dehydrogenase [compost metagenome]